MENPQPPGKYGATRKDFMTFAEAKKMLPAYAKVLASEVESVTGLRMKVLHELREYENGDNPLTTKQVDGLYGWLNRVPRN